METEREQTVRELLALDRASLGESAGANSKKLKQLIKDKEKQMSAAVKELDFETAAILRDEIRALLHSL